MPVKVLLVLVFFSFFLVYCVYPLILFLFSFDGFFDEYVLPIPSMADSKSKTQVLIIRDTLVPWRKFYFKEPRSIYFNVIWIDLDVKNISVDCSLALQVYGRCPSNNEITRLLSHRAAWTWMHNNNVDVALVVEDNMILNTDVIENNAKWINVYTILNGYVYIYMYIYIYIYIDIYSLLYTHALYIL